MNTKIKSISIHYGGSDDITAFIYRFDGNECVSHKIRHYIAYASLKRIEECKELCLDSVFFCFDDVIIGYGRKSVKLGK